MSGRGESVIYFDYQNLTFSADVNVDHNIILKYILHEYRLKMWIFFFWLLVGANRRIFNT